ncbi:MAG: hypothetical protein U9Q81_26025 [Pseudomonadota bacterium]|nr:hypothetical protein [Pseudomonadota bacterium]
MIGLAAAGWLCNGEIGPTSSGFLVATAQARFGRPATPGVGAGGVGGPASGVGVLPGAGAGKAGVGYSGGVGPNLGGPVNRVGVR